MPDALASQNSSPILSLSLNKLVFITCLLVALYFAYQRYSLHNTEQAEASVLVLTPKINDIYFLDFRFFSDKLAHKNKYKLAKVVRVTDDNLVVVYGRFFYQWQYAVINSIEYGDLRNHDYFTLIPDYIPLNKLQEMQQNGAIYLVKRPIGNKLYGNFVSPEKANAFNY